MRGGGVCVGAHAAESGQGGIAEARIVEVVGKDGEGLFDGGERAEMNESRACHSWIGIVGHSKKIIEHQRSDFFAEVGRADGDIADFRI